MNISVSECFCFSLPVSGMILSRHVFRFLHFGGASTARTVHLLASYWGLVLMSFHAGMHGNVMMGMFRKVANTQRPSKIGIWILRMIAVLLAICGIHAFVKNGIGSYLFLRTQFVFVDFSQSVCQRTRAFSKRKQGFFCKLLENEQKSRCGL